RFVAPLRDIEAPAAAAHRRSPAWAFIVAGLAVLVLGAAAFVALRPRSPAESRVMVAVLPFDNLTGDARQEYFSDGLTEEMITQLGERDPDHLGVIARTSVMHYKNEHAPMDQIARSLGVEYVLEGSVRRDPNDIRITAQLIRASDQSQLWARQYDRKPADLLALQGEIALAVRSESHSSRSRPPLAVRTVSAQTAHAFAAYVLYLRGMYDLNKRRFPDLESAASYFQQAIDADPQYARAYAALADTYA